MTKSVSCWKRQSGLTLIELLIILAVIGVLIALYLPVLRNAGEPARRALCTNNLKQIGLALHSYAETYGVLPPAYTVDHDGKPLHSWRTLILPFVGEPSIYNNIDLTKPWDDPANAEAFKSRIYVYECPSRSAEPGYTTYKANAAQGGCFGQQPKSWSDITDPRGETLMVIEVDQSQAIHWMCPQDASESQILEIGPKSRLSHSRGTHGLMADGSVRFLSSDLPDKERKSLISIAGNDNR